MPQSKKRTNRKPARKPRTPKEEAAQSLDGIFVSVTPGENGQQIGVSAVGAVKETELPTILRLAAQLAERQLGVE